MPDILFPDLSNFQANVDWPTLRQACGVVAEEVSWGLATSVPAGRVAAIRAQNFGLVVWYMGLRSDQDVTRQVLAFRFALGTLLPHETVCVDWEDTPNVGVPTPAQRDEAIAALAFAFGRPVSSIGTYAPADLLAADPAPPGWVWAASYETTEPSVPHTLWQYTDGQYVSLPAAQYSPVNWPGVGQIDTSVFHGSLYEMAVALLPPATPAPTPAPSPAPVPPAPSPMPPEADVTQHEITLPALDANGNGWFSAASLGIADVNKIVSVVWIVGSPSTSGYQKVPSGWAIDANQQLVVEGGTPGGQYGCILNLAP